MLRFLSQCARSEIRADSSGSFIPSSSQLTLKDLSTPDDCCLTYVAQDFHGAHERVERIALEMCFHGLRIIPSLGVAEEVLIQYIAAQ